MAHLNLIEDVRERAHLDTAATIVPVGYNPTVEQFTPNRLWSPSGPIETIQSWDFSFARADGLYVAANAVGAIALVTQKTERNLINDTQLQGWAQQMTGIGTIALGGADARFARFPSLNDEFNTLLNDWYVSFKYGGQYATWPLLRAGKFPVPGGVVTDAAGNVNQMFLGDPILAVPLTGGVRGFPSVSDPSLPYKLWVWRSVDDRVNSNIGEETQIIDPRVPKRIWLRVQDDAVEELEEIGEGLTQEKKELSFIMRYDADVSVGDAIVFDSGQGWRINKTQEIGRDRWITAFCTRLAPDRTPDTSGETPVEGPEPITATYGLTTPRVRATAPIAGLLFFPIPSGGADWTVGRAINAFRVPAAIGPRRGITYYAKDGALPEGIEFDSTSRLITGQPTAANLGDGTVVIIADDGVLQAEYVFNFTVSQDDPAHRYQRIAPRARFLNNGQTVEIYWEIPEGMFGLWAISSDIEFFRTLVKGRVTAGTSVQAGANSGFLFLDLYGVNSREALWDDVPLRPSGGTQNQYRGPARGFPVYVKNVRANSDYIRALFAASPRFRNISPRQLIRDITAATYDPPLLGADGGNISSNFFDGDDSWGPGGFFTFWDYHDLGRPPAQGGISTTSEPTDAAFGDYVDGNIITTELGGDAGRGKWVMIHDDFPGRIISMKLTQTPLRDGFHWDEIVPRMHDLVLRKVPPAETGSRTLSPDRPDVRYTNILRVPMQAWTKDTEIEPYVVPEPYNRTGVALTYSTSSLPDGITFTPSTRTFGGTPTASKEDGEITVTAAWTDAEDNTHSASIKIAYAIRATECFAVQPHIPPVWRWDEHPSDGWLNSQVAITTQEGDGVERSWRTGYTWNVYIKREFPADQAHGYIPSLGANIGYSFEEQTTDIRQLPRHRIPIDYGNCFPGTPTSGTLLPLTWDHYAAIVEPGLRVGRGLARGDNNQRAAGANAFRDEKWGFRSVEDRNNTSRLWTGFGGGELQNQGLGQDPPVCVIYPVPENRAGTWTTEGAIDFEYVLNREANEATPADLHPDLPGAQWPYTPKYLSQGLFQYIDYCIQPMGYLKEDGLPRTHLPFIIQKRSPDRGYMLTIKERGVGTGVAEVTGSDDTYDEVLAAIPDLVDQQYKSFKEADISVDAATRTITCKWQKTDVELNNDAGGFNSWTQRRRGYYGQCPVLFLSAPGQRFGTVETPPYAVKLSQSGKDNLLFVKQAEE